MKSPRILFSGAVILTALGMGFAVGWLAKSGNKAAMTSALKGPEAHKPTPAIQAQISPGRMDQGDMLVTTVAIDKSLRTRAADTMAWLKSRHRAFQISAFVGDELNTELAIILGLKPNELDQLEAAVKQTRERLSDLQLHSATAHVSADAKTLVVTVPGMPVEGGALYTGLVDNFSQILGPDRYQLFNDITGESFDRNFDRFGLNPVTYELILQPRTVAGDRPIYAVKRSSMDTEDKSSSWSTGNMDRADLERAYPVMAHFFTTDLGK